MLVADLRGDGDDSVAVGAVAPLGGPLLYVLQLVVCLTLDCGPGGGVAGEEAASGEGVGAQGQAVDAPVPGRRATFDGGVARVGVGS